MPGVRRIMISLPQSLLEEVDGLLCRLGQSRNEFVCEAMTLYIQEAKKRYVLEQMKRGYQEMAQLNLALAQEHCQWEDEVQGIYEYEYVGIRYR